jgi:hypothetical protein
MILPLIPLFLATLIIGGGARFLLKKTKKSPPSIQKISTDTKSNDKKEKTSLSSTEITIRTNNGWRQGH